MNEIELPHQWEPRHYQVPLWNYLVTGGKRAIAIWHRRAGKDEVALNFAACATHNVTGDYWHMLPQASQARKAIWEAINPHTGNRRIDDAFPRDLREVTRENEMYIRFKCGSGWRVVGSDNYNSLVGSPPVGIVFSEWALSDPASWAYIRPILRENGGWALFITTPRGRNHACQMYETARDDPEWFAEVLPATKTGVFSERDLETEKSEMVRELGKDEGDAAFRQEYLCSFDAGLLGSYYGSALEAAMAEGRIGGVPWLPTLPVHTGWDLGRRDSTTVWFFQLVGHELHFIDYLENSGAHISWYAKELDKKPYKYGKCCLPHDAENEHLAADKTIAGQLRDLGYREQLVVPRTNNIDQDIQAVRAILPRCRFDKVKCERGIEALRGYRRSWDDKRKVFSDSPLHDWSSHGADGFRTGALAMSAGLRNAGPPKKLPYPRMSIV